MLFPANGPVESELLPPIVTDPITTADARFGLNCGISSPVLAKILTNLESRRAPEEEELLDLDPKNGLLQVSRGAMPNIAGVDRSSLLSGSLSSGVEDSLWFLTNTTQEAIAASARAEDTPAIAVEFIPPLASLSDNGTLASPKVGELDLE